LSFFNLIADICATQNISRRFSQAAQAGFLVALTVVSGCSQAPPAPPVAVTTKTFLASPVVSMETQSLSPSEVRRLTEPPTDTAYVLGPDDQISISVYLHPELSAPSADVTTANGGVLITSDGTVGLPLIGSVKLGGLTIRQAQQVLTNDYALYVTDPKVAIQLVQAQSFRYYLLGAFSAPGIKYPMHPLTLLEALSLGGTVDIPNADLYQAYVAQGNSKLPVDLYSLLVHGDLTQNITLASGDAIVIPTSANEDAFVFGTISKPGAVPFSSGRLSLLQALSVAGMDLNSYTNTRLSAIHIIRADGQRAQFFVVNAKMIMDGQAESFDLRPGDIVFVPPTEVATWNQVLAQILPSLQVIAGVLNPFVVIHYLNQ